MASSPSPSDTPEKSPPPPPPSPSSPPPADPSPPPPSVTPPPQSSHSPPPPPPKSTSPSPSPPPPPPKSTSPSPSPPPKSDISPPPPPPPGKVNSPPPPASTATPLWSPPPPTESAVAPSSNSSSSSKKAPSSSGSSQSSGGSNDSLFIIVGVAAGAALLLFIMTLLFVACGRKKKKKSYDNNNFYGGPSPASKVGTEYYYYAKPPFQQQNNWVKATPDPHHHYQHVIQLQAPPPPVLPLTATPQTMGLSSVPPIASSSGEVSPNYSLESPPMTLGRSKSSFSYEELAAATGNFAQTNIVGQGGFGYVYKGVLPDGKEVAVKSLKSGSGQGDREFQAEVEIITRVHHRYLVSLVGYCIAGHKRMLVYEFVPNKTLEYHLHGKDRPVMDWPTRLKIALGSAKGLAYLHEDCHPRIIHRDIKASNILLEYNFEAKVADFGLAKLTSDNNTHVSTRVMGTFGYLAPEYAASGKLTEKSDTFSFGVMLLELITGRRPVDPSNDVMEDSLVDWARPLMDHALVSGDYHQLLDPRLEGNYAPKELASMVACAGACTRHSARRRPKMGQVVRALEGDLSLDVLNSWNKQNEGGESDSSAEGGANSYSADLRNFRKIAFSQKEYTSSEYGATSEYGLNPSCSSSELESQELATRKV